MNKIILLLTFIALSASFSTFAQRPLPRTQDKIEFLSDDVVGTWKWFCGSVVTVSPDGNVKAVWDDGRCATARYEKIEDNKYRFIWGNNEWIDILKLKKEGNILDGQNQCGNKVTATKIASSVNTGIAPDQPEKRNPQDPKRSQISETSQKYSGKWKMSSWGGNYELFADGRVSINNDGSKPNGGMWLVVYDRLYLIWNDCSDVDVFKLNAGDNMKLERIDNRTSPGVTFEKIQGTTDASANRPLPIRRRVVPIPSKS